jgi:hypothetical protein
MTEAPRRHDGTTHQLRADATTAAIRMHRKRPEQQRRAARAGPHVPEPHGADNAAALGRDERKLFRRPAPFAKPLGGLAEPGRTVCGVEQRLARNDIGRPFVADRDHVNSFPA